MNALLDETKSDRIEFGLPFLRELKVQPSVKAILLEEKPSNMGWGDFAIFAMLGFVLIARIMRFDIRGVIGLGVRLIGARPDDSPEPPDSRRAHPTSVGSPAERRPLARKTA